MIGGCAGMRCRITAEHYRNLDSRRHRLGVRALSSHYRSGKQSGDHQGDGTQRKDSLTAEFKRKHILLLLAPARPEGLPALNDVNNSDFGALRSPRPDAVAFQNYRGTSTVVGHSDRTGLFSNGCRHELDEE